MMTSLKEVRPAPRSTSREDRAHGPPVEFTNGPPDSKQVFVVNDVVSEITDYMEKMKRRCRKAGAKKRKKVIRKNGKRYYRAGKSGLRRLKGSAKPPFRRR